MVVGSALESLERDHETREVKVGYASILHQTYPLNDAIGACETEERAFFFDLETTNLDIPDAIQFPDLKFGTADPTEEIDPKHHDRLHRIWAKVVGHWVNLDTTRKSLKTHWNSAPTWGLDDTSERIVQETPIYIQKRYRRAVRATIARSNRDKVLAWQSIEKALRRQFYEAHKNYLVALRLYYAMLLERSEPQETKKRTCVLPENHPSRNDIVNRIKHLELIDASHQAISGSKAAHHEQGKRRLRKNERVPYVTHELQVQLATLFDTAPFVLTAEDEKGETHHAIDLVLLATVTAVHDVKEDTDLSTEDLISFLARLLDKYDSSLDPTIESGFPDRTRDSIKRKVLDLFGSTRRSSTKQVIRIVSNNTRLSREKKGARRNEVKKAAEQRIAGLQTTKRLLDIDEVILASWHLDSLEDKKAKTFEMFPEEHDGEKLTKFLIRLNAITDNASNRQIALITKLEDRAHNLDTLDGSPTEIIRTQLRATTTRLIAWSMLDHDHAKMPLYNALPRIIDTALRVYEKLAIEHQDMLEECDTRYIEQLRQWQTEVIRFELPAKVERVVEEFREAKAKRKSRK